MIQPHATQCAVPFDIPIVPALCNGLLLLLCYLQDNCSDISSRSLTHAIDMEQQPLWNGEQH
jgi:hypothetical protein